MKQVIKKVVDGVHDEMYDAVVFGDQSWIWEKDYDRSTITVEGHEVRMANGFMMWDVQVVVDHDNDHSSPTLEKAIMEALPCMQQIRDEVDENKMFN